MEVSKPKFKKDYDVIMKLEHIKQNLLSAMTNHGYNIEEVFNDIGYEKETAKKFVKDETYFPSLTLVIKIVRFTGIKLEEICTLQDYQVTKEQCVDAHKTMLKLLKKNAEQAKRCILERASRIEEKKGEIKKEILELTYGY